MQVEVVMPKMGESLQEGTIINWMKKEGETVDRDEMILEISTDKVDTEVPSPVSGVVAKILVQEEETVEVGTPIALIETDATAAGSTSTPTPVQATEPAPAPVQEAPAPVQAVEPTPVIAQEAPVPVPAPVVSGGDLVDLVMPKMGESLQEGTIVNWIKAVGDKVERDEMVLEISTDKVDTEVPSPVEGTLAEILFQEEETVEVGVVIARISTGGSVVATAPAPVSAPIPTVAATVAPAQTVSPIAASTPVASGTTFDIPRSSGGKFFSPLVRAIAEQNKVSLEELIAIQGTGVQGRVSKNDLTNYLSSRGSALATVTTSVAPAPAPVVSPVPAPERKVPAVSSAPAIISGPDKEVVPMDRMRKLIADHMVMSKRTSAHVTSTAEVDMTNVVNFRNKNKDAFLKQEGIKLTYTSFFAKAIMEGVRAFPGVNVSIDGSNVINHKRVNLGIATALPDGNLIVPVIKSADSLSITGLQRAVTDLASKARSKQLNPDDIQGGTITVTNVGTFGTLFGTPIINQPQTCIIGVGAIKKRPVVMTIDGQDAIVIRHMMYMTITYDHRIIDGMLAGQTLRAMSDSLENMNESTIQL